MKIGIEAERANNPTKTGVEHYARELILHLAKIDTENQYILYLRTVPEEWILNLPKNFTHKVMPFPYFWTQLRLSWEMWQHRPDVLFIPASSMPLVHPKNTVVTVHDLAFMMYPETYTAFQRYFHMFEDVLVSQMAKKIIAVSESTKRDFMKFWKVSEKRISVVHHGFTPISHSVIPDSTSESSSTGNPESMSLNSGSRVAVTETPLSGMTDHRKLDLPEKYILFLSTLQPRKNLPRLVEAFKKLKEKHPNLPHKLVVAGKAGWKSEESMSAINANKDLVTYVGHITDEQRAELYAKTSALCVPALYEGFGMWILEAFDAGVPVITSNISSLPEVGGSAVEYCEPENIDSILQALENVLLNEKRATELVALGKQRLTNFSWDKCAKETLEVLVSR